MNITSIAIFLSLTFLSAIGGGMVLKSELFSLHWTLGVAIYLIFSFGSYLAGRKMYRESPFLQRIGKDIMDDIRYSLKPKSILLLVGSSILLTIGIHFWHVPKHLSFIDHTLGIAFVFPSMMLLRMFITGVDEKPAEKSST